MKVIKPPIKITLRKPINHFSDYQVALNKIYQQAKEENQHDKNR